MSGEPQPFPREVSPRTATRSNAGSAPRCPSRASCPRPARSACCASRPATGRLRRRIAVDSIVRPIRPDARQAHRLRQRPRRDDRAPPPRARRPGPGSASPQRELPRTRRRSSGLPRGRSPHRTLRARTRAASSTTRCSRRRHRGRASHPRFLEARRGAAAAPRDRPCGGTDGGAPLDLGSRTFLVAPRYDGQARCRRWSARACRSSCRCEYELLCDGQRARLRSVGRRRGVRAFRGRALAVDFVDPPEHAP